MDRPLLKMQSVSPPEKRQRTGFLDLPPELRNRIYDMVLHGNEVGRKDLWFAPEYFRSNACRVKQSLQTTSGISRASRELHAEVTPILYGNTTFVFYTPDKAEAWVGMIGKSITHVRRFSIQERGILWDGLDLKHFLASMNQCRNFEFLQIEGRLKKAGRADPIKGLTRLLLPICTNAVQKARERDSTSKVANVLKFLHLESLDMGSDILRRLEDTLRAPEEEPVLEMETLQAVQRMFDPEDRNADMLL